MKFDHQFNLFSERAFFTKIDNSSFSLLKSGSRIMLCEHAKTWKFSTAFSNSNCCFTFLWHKLWPYDCYRVSLFIFTDIFIWDNRNICNFRVLSRFIYTLFWHGAMSLFLCAHRSSPAFPKKFRLIDVTIVKLTFFGFPRCSHFPALPTSRTP